MFCPKCHTYIEDDSLKFCKRCGTEINKKKTHSSFSSASTFKYMSKYGKNTHQNQYEYSKDYSDVKNEADDTHLEQFNYSNKYSQVKAETPNEHADQHNYSKNYSQVKINTQNSHADQHNYSKNYSQVKINTQNSHADQHNYSNNYSQVNINTQDNHDDQYNYSKLYTIKENYVTSDDDYLKAFIGNSFREITNMKYSIPSLLFGPLYLIYRKMFAIGIILEILILIIQALTTDGISTTINILINLALFYKFKNLYINYAHKKVDEIKTLNSDKSSTEIINLCKYKGGTISAKKIFTYAIIIYLISSIISALSTDVPTTTTSKKDILETYTIQDYEYKIDKELSNSYNKTITPTYQRFAYMQDDNRCTYTISKVGYYSTAREYLLRNQTSYQEDYAISMINDIEINNNEWQTQYFLSKYENKKITYYVLKDNNDLYTIEYESNNSNPKCEEIVETILDTFKKSN